MFCLTLIKFFLDDTLCFKKSRWVLIRCSLYKYIYLYFFITYLLQKVLSYIINSFVFFDKNIYPILNNEISQEFTENFFHWKKILNENFNKKLYIDSVLILNQVMQLYYLQFFLIKIFIFMHFLIKIKFFDKEQLFFVFIKFTIWLSLFSNNFYFKRL